MSTPSSAGDDCRLEAGELAVRTPQGWLLPDGRTVASLADCYIAVGAGWRIETTPSPPRRTRRNRMDPIPVPPTSEEVVAQVSDDATLLPLAPPVVAHEVQAAATPTASELGKLAESAGDNPLLALGLAAIAVLGGGSAWKLWTKRSEQAHELAMKRLELDAATMNGTAQPPPCQAKQAETETRLVSMEARLAKAEKTSLALPDGFDADELTGRLSKVEGAIKRMGVKPPAAKGGTK